MPVCYQVNLQTSPGGGEIFTRFFTEALVSLGWETVLVVARDARFWQDLDLPARLIAIDEGDQLSQALPPQPVPVITHNVLGATLARRIAADHRLGGFVHMPFYGRDPAGLPWYARLFAVSKHVLASLASLGLTSNIHEEPVYGLADLRPRNAARPGSVLAASPYDWDRRKFRDRVLATLQPFADAMRARRELPPRTGFRIGIVSRITPIKQFPLMFSILAPVLARRPEWNLDIFGSGGFASVRDLRHELEPLGKRARFWGQQSDVAAIYPRLDYVISGLPEKEALGLNLLEAQSMGTPVLAVSGPPFTETVAEGVTGFLFEDPRLDSGHDFGALLDRIACGDARLDALKAPAHMERFSQHAFQARVAHVMAALAGPVGTR